MIIETKLNLFHDGDPQIGGHGADEYGKPPHIDENGKYTPGSGAGSDGETATDGEYFDKDEPIVNFPN